MANRWYVKQDGQELGPFSDSGLRRFLESDQARPGVLVRNGLEGEWLAPSQLGMAANSAAPAEGGVAKPAKATPSAATEVVEPIENLPLAAEQSTVWSRPRTWAAAGAGFVTLLSAACIGAWLLAKHLDAERRTAAAPAPASPTANPAIANLEQETKRLREELADLQGRLPERERPAPEASADPALRPFNLTEERAALAQEIAIEMARQEDLQERFNYEQGLLVDAADAGVDLPPYRSLRDERYVIHLPAVELELSKLDREGLAARRAAFEQAASDRAKRIEQLQSRIRQAVAALDVGLAGQTLKQYLPLVDGDDYDRGVKLLRQFAGARVERLLEYVRAMPDDARQALADGGPPPAELMRRFNDQELILGLKKHLPQLASLVISQRKNIEWNRLQDQIHLEGNLTLMRKWRFLHQAFLLKQQGELTPARAKEFVETFGVFRLEGEPSLADGSLTAFLQADEGQPPFEMFKAYCEGAILRVPLTELYAECRKLAGEAWPHDVEPHPLAGHWAGPAKWHMYVDPNLDAITFIRPKGKPVVQRICKVGPDYLAAYEQRSRTPYPSGAIDEEPFRAGFLESGGTIFDDLFDSSAHRSDGPLLPYSARSANQYLALTLYVAVKKGQKSLRVFRKEIEQPTFPEREWFEVESEPWKKLGQAEEYRDGKVRFHYVDDKLKP